MIPHVLIPKFAEISGYTKGAIDSKIKNKVWIEGTHWYKAPDGRIFIAVEAVTQWITQNYQNTKASRPAKIRSGSPSSGKAIGTGKL